MNLAVGAQRLIAGIRVDIAVDRDRHAVQLVGEEREAVAQRGEEIGNARGVDLYRVDAAGVPGHAAREMNRGHDDQAWTATVVAASIASSTRGGDSGSSVNRMPVASRIALATAASGGTIGTSPTPRTP